MDRSSFVVDKVAYELEQGGYNFKATHLHEPKGQSLIEIAKGGQLVKEFLFPSYKIYNISAHAHDIAEGLDRESDEGLLLAGTTGFGGNVFASKAESKLTDGMPEPEELANPGY